jgi:hypothetical protein
MTGTLKCGQNYSNPIDEEPHKPQGNCNETLIQTPDILW